MAVFFFEHCSYVFLLVGEYAALVAAKLFMHFCARVFVSVLCMSSCACVFCPKQSNEE